MLIIFLGERKRVSQLVCLESFRNEGWQTLWNLIPYRSSETLASRNADLRPSVAVIGSGVWVTTEVAKRSDQREKEGLGLAIIIMHN